MASPVQTPEDGAGAAQLLPSPKSAFADLDLDNSSSYQVIGPPRTSSSSEIAKSAHRQSFAENLRNVPQSPRHRQSPSTQDVAQDLLNYPSSRQRQTNTHFTTAQWGDIPIGELVSQDDVEWVSLDSSVEETTRVLFRSKSNVVLIRERNSHQTCLATFDYSDLNSYLLVVVGFCNPEPHEVQLYNDIVLQAQDGAQISLRQIRPICRQEPVVTLLPSDTLSKAIELLGSGVRRIIVTSSLGDVVGILSQLQVVDFFWNEGFHFPTIDRLYSTGLHSLGIGSQQAVFINCDAPLSDALKLMDSEGLTSVAVVDNGRNVVGNISTKDVRHLTTTSSAPLLHESCMHFLSIILNERGVEKGRDAFPVFYVTQSSTLAHVVGKLTATRSHRMWIVQSVSTSPSLSIAPATGSQVVSSGSSTAAAVLPGAHLSGKLSGVVSLTDVLNIFARTAGLHPTDPGEQRARRRRSPSKRLCEAEL